MSIEALQDYTFISKSARYDKSKRRRETWAEATDRVKQMHLRRYPHMAEDIEWAFQQVLEKRCLGSQRALQFGGKPIEDKNARLYNCLGVETEFITSQGVKSFSDFNDGDEITVLTHTGNWRKAVVRCYGKQKLHKVTVKRGSAVHEVRATKNHRWILTNGEVTDNLEKDDTLMFAPDVFGDFDYQESSPDERLYWAYGYVYGDGTLVKNDAGEYRYSIVRLCGDAFKYRERFEELGFSTSTSLSLQGDYMAFTGKYLKTLPDPMIDEPRLIRAFVRGYMDADGTVNRSRSRGRKYGSPSEFCGIQATGKESIDFIRSIFPMVGVYVVSEEDRTDQVTNYGKRCDVTSRFRTTNGVGKTAAKFRVIEVEKEGVFEDVWCLEVEEDRSFVLPFGLVTGNCTASYCDRIRFFQEAFWLLLCGCGVGFSVQRHHIKKLPEFTRIPHLAFKKKTHIIEDSIEGWADALGILLATYFYHPEFTQWIACNVEFDYSKIRPEGSDLASGVGKAPGPEPLRKALDKIRTLLDSLVNQGQTELRPIDAYDVMMHASDAVLSGGVRRSATLCLFSANDEEMAKAKTGNWRQENPQRGRSNNSALLIRNETTKEQFASLMEFVREYGEPGFIWSDSTEAIYNPCVEIGMRAINETTGESGWQGCNLTEINGKMIRSKSDFIKAATAAAIIGTLQAGYTSFPYLGKESEEIFEREALLGVSITGIMDSPDIIFDAQLQRDMAQLVLDVNAEIAAKIGIKPAARATCVKPAGTTSCILGTASGVHYHHAKRYFRRQQGNILENPLRHYKQANPLAVEKSVWSANGTDEIITFCVEPPEEAGVKDDADAVTFLSMVKFVQENWVAGGKREEACVKPWLSHNVSNTVIVQPSEWPAIIDYIYDNRQSFAGISFIAASGDLDYPQAPMCEVHNAAEIAEIYGEGSMFASGLIVDGLRAFNDNLWVACDAVNGLGEPIVWDRNPIEPRTLAESLKQSIRDVVDKLSFGVIRFWGSARSDLEVHKLERQYQKELSAVVHKVDWIRRAKQFAERYFDGDIKKMSHCLKEVHNWKLWQDLQREHVPVDFTTMVEDSDETTLQQEWACAGGACEVR